LPTLSCTGWSMVDAPTSTAFTGLKLNMMANEQNGCKKMAAQQVVECIIALPPWSGMLSNITAKIDSGTMCFLGSQLV
jgi:hypothetical protein